MKIRTSPFSLSCGGMNRRRAASKHSWLRQLIKTDSRSFKAVMTSALLPLVFLYALIVPQSAMSADENAGDVCTIEPGTIDTQNEFTASSTGVHYKLTCSGDLAKDLDNDSIKKLLEEASGLQAGTSTLLIDLGEQSGAYGVSIDSNGGLTLVTGTITNADGVSNGYVVATQGTSPVDNEGERRDVVVESDAKITAGGDRRGGLSVSSTYGANVRATNSSGGEIKVEGDGAVGIHASSSQEGSATAENAGSVTVEGSVMVVDETDDNDNTITTSHLSYGVHAMAQSGTAAAVNRTGGTITTGKSKADDDEEGEGTSNNTSETATGGMKTHALYASTQGENAGEAIAVNEGTIATYGEGAYGVLVEIAQDKSQTDASSAGASNSGTVTTQGDKAIGVAVHSPASHLAASQIVVNNSGEISTEGKGAGGVEAFFKFSSAEENAFGTATASNSGKITVKGGGSVNDMVAGVSAGFRVDPNINNNSGNEGDTPAETEPTGPAIQNSGHATVTNTGTVTVSGDLSVGLSAVTYGTGKSTIRVTGGTVKAGHEGPTTNTQTTGADGGTGTSTDQGGNEESTNTATPAAKAFGIGLWGQAINAASSDDEDDSPNVVIVVSGSSTMVEAYGAASDTSSTEEFDESRGIAILADVSGTNGHSQVDIAGGATVKAFAEGEEQNGYAVMFKGGKGVLNLRDSSLTGDVSFADGDYDDVINITNTEISSITGDIHFFGGEDQLNVEVAEQKSVLFDGDITGVHTFKKSGKGDARLYGDVTFDGSALNLDEGALVVAGTLDLKTGTLTVKDAGRLVFEVAATDDHGSLSAGKLHFEGTDSSEVFVQLSHTLTATEVSALQSALGQASLTLMDVDEVTSGTASSSVANLTVNSQSSSGAINKVGTLVTASGIANIDPNTTGSIARINDPNEEVMEAQPSSSGGSSDSNSGLIGLGLLAALLAYFYFDDDSGSSFADYGLISPQSAYIATVNDKGKLTFKDNTNQPYRMWIRTGNSLYSMNMTGLNSTGVSGSEVGMSLYDNDDFYVEASVVPNVNTSTDALNMSADGSMYALNSGWRNDRYFAGIRLSHGEFETNSVMDNSIVNSALISNTKVRNTQTQFRAGTTWEQDQFRFVPSLSLQAGRFDYGAHTAESPMLEAQVPGFTQDYAALRVGLKMISNDWLSFSEDAKWKPHFQIDSIRTKSDNVGELSLRQSDRLGVLGFNSTAGIRAMPEVINSVSFGTRIKSTQSDDSEWKLGFAGLEADGEEYYAVMAAYQLQF